jgi:hypothetical protein
MLVRVLRPLCIRAERQEPGTVIDLPDHVAREAIWLGKAERAPAAKPEPSPEPMTTESASILVKGKAGGRKKDAGQ